MTVDELIELLGFLPGDMHVAIGTSRRGKFGNFHIEHIGVNQRRTWPIYIKAECPECGDTHSHASSVETTTEPKLVSLGTTIDPVPIREGTDPPEPKLYGRWPRGVKG